MCKSMAEGGQRCAAHTHAKLMTKSAAVEEAVAALSDGTGDPAALRAAQDEWETAAAEYASTSTGHQHLSAQAAAADASGDLDTACLLNTVVARGEALRAANRETAALMNAVRLAKTDPVSLVKPAGTGPVVSTDVDTRPAEPSGPVVPDLDPAQREQWVAALARFEEMAPDIERVGASTGYAYPQDVIEGLPKIDATIGDADSDDKDLAQAVHSAGYFAGMRYAYPNWKTSDEDLNAPWETRQETNRAQAKRWQQFVEPMRECLDAQSDRALGHPNAGLKTFEKAEEKGFATSTDLTARPNVPLAYLKDAIRTESSDPDRVHANGWEKAREIAFTDNSMAILLAAKDPDSFQRNEAFNRVMTTPFDTISTEDRHWLAGNLHRMPGGPENQRILASSLKSWALGYTDSAERKRLGTQFLKSEVPEVVSYGRELFGQDRDLVAAGEKKKGWFR